MVDRIVQLEAGRRHVASGAWADAVEALLHLDSNAPLDVADLELLATASYMAGLEAEFAATLERVHLLWIEADDPAPAARSAFWLGIDRLFHGEVGTATGWFGRASRLVERVDGECAERGYLLLPLAMQHGVGGDWSAAATTAGEAAAIGERCGDRDLFALAAHEQGHALARSGQVEAGLALIDEAMVATTTGELSPMVTGLVYCSVIDYCQQLYEIGRSREWTAALTRWCDEQPQMLAYSGQCMVHRAELMQIGGAWSDAIEEAGRALQRATGVTATAVAGHASYRRGEILRLRGNLGAAEDAYRGANELGWEPQPGLALLRLAQGRRDTAAATIVRALGETTEPLRRAALLPVAVEISLAAGDIDGARASARELESIAEAHPRPMLLATAAGATGAVALAEGDAAAALVALRPAWQRWQELGAPYEAARVRVLVGLCCRALGDEDAAELELEAARTTFAALDAGPDLTRVNLLTARPGPTDAHALTRRELEVLRHIATGRTNKAIAAQLVLSERTVDRHVSNILTKLGVASRAAATAYAYEHELV